MTVSELGPCDVILVGTGYFDMNNKNIDFQCVISGVDYKDRVVLDAQNTLCLDGRNKIRPYFVVDKRSKVEKETSFTKGSVPGCIDTDDLYRLGVAYVIYDLEGMDREGRFVLRTLCE